jgi:hypothetical protein
MKKYSYNIMELTNKSSYIINKLMLNKFEGEKYSRETKLYYNNLYDLFENIENKDVTSKEDRREIQKDFNIQLSLSKFISEDIRKYIKNKGNVRIKYKLKILRREIEIDFFLFEINNFKLEKYIDYLDKRVIMMKLVLYYMIKNSSKECNNKLHIIVYLTEIEKFLPKKRGEIIGPENVNSGYSYVCVKSGLIVVFRREEWFKVFIHESMHSFGMEFSNMKLNELNKELGEIFKINVEINLFEAYTEFWAELINIGVISYVNNVRNKRNYIKNVEKSLDIERFYSIYQAKKILEFNNILYKNLLEKETRYKENSSVFSYYIIKCIMMINLNRIINWCYKNNKNFIKFEKTTNNLKSFLKLIREISEKDKTKKILENSNNLLNNNYIGKNLRMSVIEI